MNDEASAQLFLRLEHRLLGWVMGESNSPRHPGEIEVDGWQWEYSDPEDQSRSEAAKMFGNSLAISEGEFQSKSLAALQAVKFDGSLSDGETSAVSEGGPGLVTVYKNVDRSTPTLMSALVNADVFPKAVITMMHRMFQGASVVLTLKEVRVVSYEVMSSHGSANVTLQDKVELAYEKLRIDYQSRGEQVDVGGVSIGHTRTFEVENKNLGTRSK